MSYKDDLEMTLGKGQPGGVANLDATGKVPAGLVPSTGGVTDHALLTNVTADQHHPQAHAHAGTYEASGAVATHAAIANAHGTYQPTSEKAQANGYAGLDATGKVPSAQLPAYPAPGPTVLRVTANQTISVTALTAVTGLSFNGLANTRYKVRAVIFHQTAAITTGARFGMTVPAGATLKLGILQPTAAPADSVALADSVVAAANTAIRATAAGPGPTSALALIEGVVAVGATPGAVALVCGSEVAASAVTIEAESYLEILPIS